MLLLRDGTGRDGSPVGATHSSTERGPYLHVLDVYDSGVCHG